MPPSLVAVRSHHPHMFVGRHIRLPSVCVCVCGASGQVCVSNDATSANIEHHSPSPPLLRQRIDNRAPPSGALGPLVFRLSHSLTKLCAHFSDYVTAQPRAMACVFIFVVGLWWKVHSENTLRCTRFFCCVRSGMYSMVMFHAEASIHRLHWPVALRDMLGICTSREFRNNRHATVCVVRLWTYDTSHLIMNTITRCHPNWHRA